MRYLPQTQGLLLIHSPSAEWTEATVREWLAQDHDANCHSRESNPGLSSESPTIKRDDDVMRAEYVVESVNRDLIRNKLYIKTAVNNIYITNLLRAFGAHALVRLCSFVNGLIGWLEPLLARIAESPSGVVTPSLDRLEVNTFNYILSANGVVVTFDWELMFHWNVINASATVAFP